MAKKYDFPFNIKEVASLLPLNVRKVSERSMTVDCFFDCCAGQNKGKGKLNINFEKDCYHCAYCGASGGMTDLYSAYCNVDRSTAYRDICNSLQTGTMADKKTVRTVDIVPPSANLAGIQELNNTYSFMSSLLRLTVTNKSHLIERGLTEEQIKMHGYRSTPTFGYKQLTQSLINKCNTVEGIPGFYMNDYGQWTANFKSYCSGVLIPYMSLSAEIQGYQIRLDKPFVDEKGRSTKYIWLSSIDHKRGSSPGSPVHFIGDPCAETIYFTEGALKANVAHCLSGRTFLAVAGTGNLGNVGEVFKRLKINGTKTIVECYDMDKFKNEKVMKNRETLIGKIQACGLKLQQITWNPRYKGIDDYLYALYVSKDYRND